MGGRKLYLQLVLMRVGRFPDEGVRPTSKDGQSLLARLGSADAADFDAIAEDACAPLPRNSASALLHRCGSGGVLAIASERPAAFTEKHRRRLASMASYIGGQL